jgi:predicted HD phosphohydrolase
LAESPLLTAVKWEKTTQNLQRALTSNHSGLKLAKLAEDFGLHTDLLIARYLHDLLKGVQSYDQTGN